MAAAIGGLAAAFGLNLDTILNWFDGISAEASQLLPVGIVAALAGLFRAAGTRNPSTAKPAGHASTPETSLTPSVDWESAYQRLEVARAHSELAAEKQAAELQAQNASLAKALEASEAARKAAQKSRDRYRAERDAVKASVEAYRKNLDYPTDTPAEATPAAEDGALIVNLQGFRHAETKLRQPIPERFGPLLRKYDAENSLFRKDEAENSFLDYPIKQAHPQGLRYNNPGNIEKTREGGDAWYGEMQTDRRFAEFIHPLFGLRAMAYLLRKSKYTKQGKRTIAELIESWAPPADNNPTASYAKFVAAEASKHTGYSITADTHLHELTDDILLGIMLGIIKFENAHFQPYRITFIADCIKSV